MVQGQEMAAAYNNSSPDILALFIAQIVAILTFINFTKNHCQQFAFTIHLATAIISLSCIVNFGYQYL